MVTVTAGFSGLPVGGCNGWLGASGAIGGASIGNGLGARAGRAALAVSAAVRTRRNRNRSLSYSLTVTPLLTMIIYGATPVLNRSPHIADSGAIE